MAGIVGTNCGTHYKNQPKNVIFELLNEPQGKLEPYWNEYAAVDLEVVRKTNPKRAVIIGRLVGTARIDCSQS